MDPDLLVRISSESLRKHRAELVGSAGAGQMKAAAAIGAEDVYEHVTERDRLPALPIHVVGEVQILLYLQQEGPETFALLHQQRRSAEGGVDIILVT